MDNKRTDNNLSVLLKSLLTLSLLMLLAATFLSTDNLCKQFGPRSGVTECRF